MMMKKIGLFSVILLLNGCMTLSGDYRVKVFDDNGNELAPKLQMVAQGSGIYRTRIALCKAFPKATIRIYDLNTNEELKRESPKKCR